MCVIFRYMFQKRLRELELEVTEKETDLEDQARQSVDDLIKKNDRIAKMEIKHSLIESLKKSTWRTKMERSCVRNKWNLDTSSI